jgi:hypothetical protein
MDLLSVLLACNLYTSDEPLVRAIAQSNSHSNTFSVVDPSMDYRQVEVPPEPKDLDAALARLQDLTSKGGKPLLGLMQVPPSWMRMFGREPRDAFDACINVSVGTAMLSALDRECAAPTGPRVEPVGRRSRRLPVTVTLPPQRACVVRKYGQAIGMQDFELLITLELGGQRPLPRASAPTDSPIVFPDPNERTWGPDCIFVPLAGSLSPEGERSAVGRQGRVEP